MNKYILLIGVFLLFFSQTLLSQKMTVKDDDNNILMEVNDEGTVGSISLTSSGGVLSVETNKLYNSGGFLMWDGDTLATKPISTSLILPYTGSYYGASDAFVITTQGTGKAARFRIDNASNSEVGLHVSTTGTGKAGYFRISNSDNAEGALEAYTTGLGVAGSFLINNASNSNPAILASTNGVGMAGYFTASNSGSGEPALNADYGGTGAAVRGYSYGNGAAGLFEIDNSANSRGALIANTIGTGAVLQLDHTGASGNIAEFMSNSAIKASIDKTGVVRMAGFNLPTGASPGHVLTSDATGLGTWQPASGGLSLPYSGSASSGDAFSVSMTGTDNRAGVFAISNGSNTEAALFASTIGSGVAIEANAEGSGSAIVGIASGTGRAGQFSIQNPANDFPALWVTTSGTGQAGVFTIENTGNSQAALYVSTLGDGPGISTGTSGAGPALHATTSGTGPAINSDGLLRTNGFQLTTTPADGYVLTSDASGTGSWQPAAGGTDSDWTISGTDMYSAVSGNVGIGTTSPVSKLHVETNETSSSYTARFLAPNTGTNMATGIMIGKNGIDSNLRFNYFPDYYGSRLGMIYASGCNPIYLRDNYNVGIGTPAPQDALHLYKSSVSTVGLLMGNSLVGGYNERQGFLVDYHGDGGAELWNFEDTDMWFGTNNVRRMIIKNDGKIGIGTTSPSNRLEIVDSSAPQLRLTAGSTYTEIRASDMGPTEAVFKIDPIPATSSGRAQIRLFESTNTTGVTGLGIARANGTSTVNHFLSSNYDSWLAGATGNIGIGTITPSQKLDVAGTAQMTGFQMPTGAANGYVLTTDATGFGTWQPAVGGADGDWTISGDDMYSAVSGNVGIGTTSPESRLHIRGGSASIRIDGSGTDFFDWQTGADNIALKRNGVPGFTWLGSGNWAFDTGNVGIGTTSPFAKLQVNDNTHAQWAASIVQSAPYWLRAEY